MPSGGKRKGAGRKPKYGKAKIQYTVRLVEESATILQDDFGGVQAGVETLVMEYVEKRTMIDPS